MKRVVVLGASGHIGRALVALLERDGVEVVGHSSKTLDLTRSSALAGLDPVAGPETTLVFAAALTPDRGQSPDTLDANVVMATNVARWLSGHEVGRCVYVGSDAVYGFDVDPVDETTPVTPSSWYGLAKYAGEKVMEYACGPRGIPLLTLRVCGVYGPADPHGSYGPSSFARSLAKDRSIRIFGNGEETRDHVYVDDVARVLWGLAQRGATGTLNVATGEARTFASIVDDVRRLVPYNVRVDHAARKGSITHRRYDVARLRRALPDVRFTPFDSGLRATLASFGALPGA